ncbi:MAG: DPP IV N-terminal domain-containing protein, partial [Acidimicrobiales bacterium]
MANNDDVRTTEIHEQPIPFEEIARFPLPGTAFPVQIAFDPSDSVLTFLHSPEGSLERRLFVVDLDASSPSPREVPLAPGATSEETLSLEEQLRRERAREVGLGVTSVDWATSGDALLVPLPGGVHVVTELAASRGAGAVARLVGAAKGAGIADPQLSPDGSMVAFVRAGELHVATVAEGGEPLRLTHTAEDGLANGLAEFVAQEEMDRDHGYWWSPDGRHIAYAEVDERHIPIYRIVHQGSDEVGTGAEEDHRYPFSGKENAIVRLGVVPAVGGPTVWMETGDPACYLARVHWTGEGDLVAELEARDQRELDVVRFDISSGAAVAIHKETSPSHLNLSDHFRPLSGGETGSVGEGEG